MNIARISDSTSIDRSMQMSELRLVDYVRTQMHLLSAVFGADVEMPKLSIANKRYEHAGKPQITRLSTIRATLNVSICRFKGLRPIIRRRVRFTLFYRYFHESLFLHAHTRLYIVQAIMSPIRSADNFSYVNNNTHHVCLMRSFCFRLLLVLVVFSRHIWLRFEHTH